MSDKFPKIALFGTSADPPTLAHQTILQWLSNHYDKVAVWASDNPFKHHQANLEQRMTMLEVLIRTIDNQPKNIELHKKLSHRRSLISVQKAQSIWGKNADYTLVIGSDLVGQIRRWYQVEALLKQVKLLIISRSENEILSKDLAQLQRIGGQYQLADLTLPNISSTAYRETQDNSLIPRSIRNYISRERLYP